MVLVQPLSFPVYRKYLVHQTRRADIGISTFSPPLDMHLWSHTENLLLLLIFFAYPHTFLALLSSMFVFSISIPSTMIYPKRCIRLPLLHYGMSDHIKCDGIWYLTKRTRIAHSGYPGPCLLLSPPVARKRDTTGQKWAEGG